MLYKIVVLGSSTDVDNLIKQICASTADLRETCQPANYLSSLGYREYHFKQNNNEFVFTHLSKSKQNGKFIHENFINEQFKQAIIGIACDTDEATIELLDTACRLAVPFIKAEKGFDMIAAIIESSLAKPQPTVEIVPEEVIINHSLSAQAERAASSVKKSAATATTLFSGRVQLALQEPITLPDVHGSIGNNQL